MIILACFVVVGFAAGFVLRLPAFTLLCLFAIVGYAVFRAGMEGGWQITYHVVLAGIALQIGYFVAIVTQTMFRSWSKGNQISCKQFASQRGQPRFAPGKMITPVLHPGSQSYERNEPRPHDTSIITSSNFFEFHSAS